MKPFALFPSQWTPVAAAAALGARPLPIRVAGEDLVIFRDGKGGIGALLDRCPHRGVKLSLGDVVDGALECPFHGWRFDTTGTCVKVPLNTLPPARLATLCTGKVPVIEKGGLIWVYTELGAEGVEPPEMPDSLFATNRTRRHVEQVWNCHWSRAMENMLDGPHLPFTHKRTIGRPLRARALAGEAMQIDLTDKPYGFRAVQGYGGENGREYNGQELDSWIEWWRPNGMCLNIPIPHMGMRQHVWCVPVDDTHTRMILVAVRELSWWNPMNLVFANTEDKALLEDKAIIETSFPVEVPDAAAEKHVPTDKATLRFRAWYLAEQERLRADPASPVSSPGEGAA
jgi:phenylpropionate dioxygenase-like ring-hydroxylating dioxygenase large terminal subunit